MSKSMVFSRRNITEILRAPTSWGFGVAMPVGILIIMQIIIKSIGEEAAQHVPMFQIDNFAGGVVVFGASFLTMFCVLLITKDRSESFLMRLYASPMKPADYILGYSVAMLPLLGLQVALTFGVAMLFGLTISLNLIPAVLFSCVSSLMFIAIGVLLGCSLNDKAAPPICSVVVQFAALFSGMWFDLDMIGGGFQIFCKCLPFANAYDIIKYTLLGDYDKIWLPLVIVLAYTLLFSILAAFAFKREMKKV